MKKNILVFLLLQQVSLAQTTLFEKSKGTESPSYEEGIKWWEEFAKVNSNVTMDTFGQTDAGYPLHLISIGKEKKLIGVILNHLTKRLF
jgi:hypothetical protein